MPDVKSIKIERKANHRLEPADQFRQKIKAGSTVTFALVPPLTGLVISFKNRSPFAASTIHYGEVHNLTAEFDDDDDANNVYKFDCEEPDAIGGKPSIDGGEIEILPS